MLSVLERVWLNIYIIHHTFNEIYIDFILLLFF